MDADEIRKLCEFIARRVPSPELHAFASRNWSVAEMLVFEDEPDATRDAIGMLLDMVSDLTIERDEAREVARMFVPGYPRDVLAEKVRLEHLSKWPWLENGMGIRDVDDLK